MTPRFASECFLSWYIFFFQCIIKQLLDSVFVITWIIKDLLWLQSQLIISKPSVVGRPLGVVLITNRNGLEFHRVWGVSIYCLFKPPEGVSSLKKELNHNQVFLWKHLAQHYEENEEPFYVMAIRNFCLRIWYSFALVSYQPNELLFNLSEGEKNKRNVH